jgi:hypothetical protein
MRHNATHACGVGAFDVKEVVRVASALKRASSLAGCELFQLTKHSVGRDLKLMKKYVLRLMTVLTGMVFIVSCTQQETTATTSPATTSAQGRTGSQTRNPPKTRGSVEAPHRRLQELLRLERVGKTVRNVRSASRRGNVGRCCNQLMTQLSQAGRHAAASDWRSRTRAES